ncbi:MAG: Ig-like domain-containing protein [Vicinamibacterales bacterium]
MRRRRIPGARVQVQQLGYPQKSVEAFADAFGIAQLTGGDALTEGAFLITATDRRNGFTGRARGEMTSDGQAIVVKVYLYNAAGSVRGTVYSTDGFTPVANAEVIVGGAQGPLAFAVTGSDGRYLVDTVPLGPITIDAFEARTGRRATGSGRIDAANQQVTIDLVESGIGMVRGTLLQRSTLLPLKGWEVTLQQQSASGLTLPSLKTTTGVDGAFSFPGTARGTFSLVASRLDVSGRGTANGWIDQEGQVVDVPVLVDIQRQLLGAITGIVLTPGGAPAANVALDFCVPGQCGASSVKTTAGVDGTFTITDVPLGRFSVVAREQTTGNAGSAYGELAFEGDAAQVTIVLSGLARVTGTVVQGNGTPAANVQVTLSASPSSGCAGDCEQSTGAAGDFAFIGVPGRTFTVTAVDTLSGLKGVAGGSLNPGEQKVLQIVLEPTTTMSGRVLTAAGIPAHGAVAELIVNPGGADERRLYRETAIDGTFLFSAVPTKPYQLQLSDPIGPGVASRQGTVVGPVSFGDVVLDEAAPQVASVTPAPAARGVSSQTNVTITFTEPILPGTINATNVTLTGPDGPVTGTLNVTSNDTVVVFDPITALKDESIYTVRVKDVKDRVQKVMPSLYSAQFTTADVTAPTVLETDPAASSGGVTIYSPIRITFSEAIDTSAFTGAPIAVTGPAGAVSGITSYLSGNRIIVFTPNVPLSESATYQVSVQKARDLAGLTQASAFSFSFNTTTRIPPTLSSLTTSTPTVVEGGIGRVVATPSATSDVLFVDFYVNGTLAGTDRTAPFEFAFSATPSVGAPGDVITVTAIPTDTSGNRGQVPGSVPMTIVADQPPVVTLGVAVPGGGLSAKNGDRIVVTVHATDDVGTTQLGYRATTGNPVDALTKAYAPAGRDQTETFAFYIPTGAAPGSIISVEALAIDTKGQQGQAAKVDITVLDAVVPTVQITGATTGATIKPGDTTTVVVTANDIGGIAALTFTAGGLVTRTDTRTVSPAQNAVVASFTVTVPATAQTGDTLTLDATATDRSGNTGTAARVILPVADLAPPTVNIQTSTGSLDATPGQTVQVIVSGADAGLLSELRLAASGGMTFATAKQVSPPSGSATLTFDVQIPGSLAAGTPIVLSATAIDFAGNVSAPKTLTLTTVSGLGVTLPSSQIVKAGETVDVAVQLASPAGAGGLRLDFTTVDPQVASVTPFVQFADGESAKTIQVTGIAGGTTLLRAFLQQVPRASMTITVSGGIVHPARCSTRSCSRCRVRS